MLFWAICFFTSVVYILVDWILWCGIDAYILNAWFNCIMPVGVVVSDLTLVIVNDCIRWVMKAPKYGTSVNSLLYLLVSAWQYIFCVAVFIAPIFVYTIAGTSMPYNLRSTGVYIQFSNVIFVSYYIYII